MENKTFKLESGSVSYDMIFEDGKVAVSLFRKLKECRLDQVTKVIQKHTSMGGGDEMSFRIFFMENGKEQNFPWVQALVNKQSTKDCIEHMKAVFPSTTLWTDKREESNTDASGRKMHDMQFLPLGYAGAGLPRGLQLWIYMLGLGVLIFPLIYIAKVLATGGYRVYSDTNGIEIKKFGSKKWAWNEIQNVDLTNINVIDQNNYSKSQVLKMVVTSKSGSKSKFVMRFDHAVPLMREMAEHGLVSAELIAKFA
jgi:hypothetical protein